MTKLIDTGHFGSLTAEQCTACRYTGFGNAANDVGDNCRIEFAAGDIIHEEQRSSALTQNIVYAMVDDIVTEAAIVADLRSKHGLGANAIR